MTAPSRSPGAHKEEQQKEQQGRIVDVPGAHQNRPWTSKESARSAERSSATTRTGDCGPIGATSGRAHSSHVVSHTIVLYGASPWVCTCGRTFETKEEARAHREAPHAK